MVKKMLVIAALLLAGCAGQQSIGQTTDYWKAQCGSPYNTVSQRARACQTYASLATIPPQ